MMDGLSGHLMRRGMNAYSEGVSTPEGNDTIRKIPAWGIVAVVTTLLLYGLAMLVVCFSPHLPCLLLPDW